MPSSTRKTTGTHGPGRSREVSVRAGCSPPGCSATPAACLVGACSLGPRGGRRPPPSCPVPGQEGAHPGQENRASSWRGQGQQRPHQGPKGTSVPGDPETKAERISHAPSGQRPCLCCAASARTACSWTGCSKGAGRRRCSCRACEWGQGLGAQVALGHSEGGE